ncbi:MAG TPA: vWA domain-containing protein [Polyangia bacterium]|nr:vWA domain-containing protein [Polyangia bacterium]
MRSAEIVKKGFLCVVLAVGACSFNPPKSGASGTGANSGSGGTVIIITSGSGGGAAQGGPGTGGGMQCAAIPKSSAKLPPDILIVQDASGSMNQDSTNATCNTGGGCGMNSKWSLMTAAIKQVTAQTDTTVNWGLKMFADQGGCGVTNNAAVPIGMGTSAAIATALQGRTDANGNVTNGSSTPTRAAEAAAVTYLGTVMDQNPKFIVLATDGQPNCPMGGGNQQADDTPATVAAVAAAKAANIPTFVVGISAGGAPEMALNMMAEAGGYPQVGQPTEYYPVSSTAEFVAVLQTLVGMATTCTYSIPNPPTNDGTTSRGNISLTGTDASGNVSPINMDPTNGWTYGDAMMTQAVLHGTACDAVMSGAITTVTIIFNCIVP